VKLERAENTAPISNLSSCLDRFDEQAAKEII
jgi:hypothetical protein